MKRLLPLLTLLLLCTSTVFADSRAEEVLKQARAAIGGEEQLQKIQGLHINGQYRRMFGERQMAGDREIRILLPNKYLVEDAMNAGGLRAGMINTRGLNGDKAWSGSSGGGGMVFRMAGPGGAQATPEQMEAGLRRIYTAEFSRYLLAMILTPPPSLAVEYKYAGESDVEDVQAAKGSSCGRRVGVSCSLGILPAQSSTRRNMDSTGACTNYDIPAFRT